MRAPLVLACALAVAGCSDLFHGDKAPEGITCSSTGTCPPGMQCVPSEHVCRTPCTQTSMNTGGMTGPTQNQQCQGLDNGSSGNAYACDYDHFCRPECMGFNSTCGGCQGTDVCDSTVNICRPACGVSGCPMTWGCVDLSTSFGGTGTPGLCAGCRPTAASTILPPLFAPVVFYDGAGGQTGAVSAGDLGGTGHPDVVITDIPSKKLFVYANDGTGAFLPPVAYAVSPQPFHAVVVDITRDGKADVVVATVGAAPLGGPVLFPGNGDHTLGGQVNGPMLPTTRLTVGDFDGDGKPDVAACGSGTSELSVVTSDGAGGLKQLAAFSMNGGNTSFVRVGSIDVNADKHLDLWGDDEHGGIRLFTSNGNASSLGFSEIMSINGSTPRYDTVNADIDGDGKLDFVWLQENASMMPTSPANVVIAHNNGGLSFGVGNASMQTVLPASGLLGVGDFDADGKIDAAVIEATTTGKSNVDILSGDGTRLIWSEQISITKNLPNSIAVVDLDGDGKLDIVLGLGAGGVAVLMNQTPSR